MPLKRASGYYYQQQQRNIEDMLAEINTNLEKIATNLEKLTTLFATYLETLTQLQSQQTRREQRGGYSRGRKTSAMDILAEEKVVFATDLIRQGKIRNINKFIASMKRRGAIVFESENEVAITDADFAKEILSEIDGYAGSEEELIDYLIKKYGNELADKIQRLVKLLRESTYIIMTPNGKWKVTVTFRGAPQ